MTLTREDVKIENELYPAIWLKWIQIIVTSRKIISFNNDTYRVKRSIIHQSEYGRYVSRISDKGSRLTATYPEQLLRIIYLNSLMSLSIHGQAHKNGIKREF
ncbi:hypothetical protein EBAPG3_011665 [Nitrosospira lacus]|uniref:Uncharacterized protein n=1 Tax=Nitrosospira lacus TaxID=1288494 RepID=A0A1W6SRG8_9PROT|nr:hypothetical protein EBAPG3_011665 [Nitrosospira lacus]